MAHKSEIKFEQPSDLLIFINRYIILILSVLIFAILMSGYYFLLKPKMASNEARQELNNKNIANEQASRRLLDNLSQLEREYKDIQENRQADLEKLKKILPTNPQVAELFVLAEKLALANGLKLNSVDISDTSTNIPKKTSTVSSDEDLDAELNNNNNSAPANPKPMAPAKLKTMSLHFALTRINKKELETMFPDGSLTFDSNLDDYTLFKNYIATLEANLRLMDIESLTLPPLSVENDRNMPSFNFSVITYYQ